jgi:hypothetical protein
MRTVFRRVAEACRDAALPVGIAPNVEVSLIVQPDDALDLLPPLDPRTWLYRGWLGLLRAAARPALRRAMATRPAPAREAVHA